MCKYLIYVYTLLLVNLNSRLCCTINTVSMQKLIFSGDWGTMKKDVMEKMHYLSSLYNNKFNSERPLKRF